MTDNAIKRITIQIDNENGWPRCIHCDRIIYGGDQTIVVMTMPYEFEDTGTVKLIHTKCFMKWMINND